MIKIDNKVVLSIIIPVYNVSNYLEKCLDSLIVGLVNKEHIEIIIVNDGSPDDSQNIINRYVEKYPFVFGYLKENGGLSDARNFGLDKAIGDYVWFFDSDDYLSKNGVDIILEKLFLDTSPTDIYVFDYIKVYENGRSDSNVLGYKNFSNSSLDIDRFFQINSLIFSNVWIYLFKRDFLLENNLFFYKGIMHEDEEFTVRAMVLSSRICFIEGVFYNYLQRTGSIMNSNSVEKELKKIKDTILIIESLDSFEKESSLPSNRAIIVKRKRNQLMLSIVLNIKTQKILNLNRFSLIETLQENNLFPLKFEGLTFKQKVFVYLFNHRAFMKFYLKL